MMAVTVVGTALAVAMMKAKAVVWAVLPSDPFFVLAVLCLLAVAFAVMWAVGMAMMKAVAVVKAALPIAAAVVVAVKAAIQDR